MERPLARPLVGRHPRLVAIHDVLTGDLDVVPDPDQPLKESDVAIVVGADEMIAALVE